MAYCDEPAVRVYAPQLPASSDFGNAIADADGVIDAHLRKTYETPISPVDRIIASISARLAAGRLLEAQQSRVKSSGSEYAEKLVDDAMSDLMRVVDDPSLISAAPRESSVEDAEKSRVMVSDGDDSLFTSGREDTWRD